MESGEIKLVSPTKNKKEQPKKKRPEWLSKVVTDKLQTNRR